MSLETLSKLLPVEVILQEEISNEASLYDVMYRRYGIRNVGKLSSPAMHPVSEWDLAKHAVLHYIPKHEKDYGMPPNYTLLNGWTKHVYVKHIKELTQLLGNPRNKFFNFNLAVRAYRKVYPRFKWCKDDKQFTLLKDNPSVLLAINYGMAGKNLRYRTIPMIEVMQWSNLRNTVWKTIADIANITDRHQFIEFELPTIIPSRMELERSTPELQRKHMKVFDEENKLNLLDFWRWMNPEYRKVSHMHLVSDRHLSHVNYVFRVGGNFVILNLARLNEWILGHGVEELDEEENAEENEQDTEEIFYKQMQRRMLKFFKLINEMRGEQNTQVVISDTDKEIDYHVDNDVEVDISDDEETEDLKETVKETLPDPQEQEVQVDLRTNEISTVEKPIAPIDNVVVEKNKETGKIEVKYLKPVQRQEIALRKNKLLQQIEASHDENIKLMSKMKDEDQFVSKVLKQEVIDNVEAEMEQEEKTPESDSPTLSAVEVKYTSHISKQASNFVKNALMTQGEMKRIEAMANSFKKIKDPYGSGRTLEEVVKEEIAEVDQVPEMTLPDIPLVTDKSMLKTRGVNFDKTYIKKVMPRDTVRSVLSVQRLGLAVTSYEKEDLIDAGNEFERHSIQVTPVGGSTSTIHVKVPKIREDGTFLSGGVSYVMKKARRDACIRKVNDNKVSLTTYYGKLFLNRSDKGKFNFDKWLLNQVELKVIDGIFDKISYGPSSHPDMDLPRELIVLATRYKQLRIKERGITLDLVNIRTNNEGVFIIGKDQNGDEVYFDRQTYMVQYGKEGAIELGELLGVDDNKRPVEYAEVGVLGESIPTGLILARHYGISELCKKLNVQPVKLERGQHIQLASNQWSLKFADEVWVFPRENKIASLILGGLQKYQTQLKEMFASQFEESDVYGTILSNEGLHIRYENELDLMEQMFIDDISEQLLEKMHEPTNFPELLIRGCELLLTGYIPTEINMEDMLIKGYERIPGAIYGELVKAARSHMMKPITSKRRFEIGPNDIWLAIQKDPSIEIRDEINPLKNIKEKNNVTFGGVGGRSRRSMTRPTRSYHESDLGTISEATVDNSDVGVTTYMSANPLLTDLYGNTERIDKDNFSASNILSDVAMTSPAADTDDLKRLGFISIQSEHRIPIAGAMPMPLRTGYENVIAHKVDKGFAYATKQDGKIGAKDNNTVTLVYKDGSKETIEYGLKMASSKGHYYKHNLVCDYEVGETFKQGDIIIFNQQFFLRDILCPGQVVQINYTLVPTALVDFEETLEDGCCVSERVSELMTTEAVHLKTVLTDVTANIRDMVKVGDHVDIDDILCIIEDQHIEATHVYDDAASDILRRLGAYTPKAGYNGKVEKIEAYYFADYEGMSDTIKAIVTPLDTARAKIRAKTKDGKAATGQLSDSTRMNGEMISRGKILFRFFIVHQDGMNSGDKLVVKTKLARRKSLRELP